MKQPPNPSRRQFISSTLAATTTGVFLDTLTTYAAEKKTALPAQEIKRKIKVGIVGCGGRGAWIANLFNEHGGFEFHAIADYFENVAVKAGAALGVDNSRCFSGLSGYKLLIESGVEAILIEDIP